jgi:hypothetical protein
MGTPVYTQRVGEDFFNPAPWEKRERGLDERSQRQNEEMIGQLVKCKSTAQKQSA